KSIETRTINAVLTPVMNGVPGARQYSGGASLDPGEYTLKLAVAEGDRLGSVEHLIHASLSDIGEFSLSDLMVGGPIDTSEVLRANLTSGGRPLKTLTRRFEIAPPSVLMTSAAGAGTSAPPASVDLFLPVDEGTLSRPFAREDALAPRTLDQFMQRVPASTKP